MKMELRETMELRIGRDKSTGKKGTPYIVEDKDPTVIHLPARGQRYYRSRPVVLPQGRTVLPLAAKRYYRTVMRYNRTGPRYCRNTSNSKVRPVAQVLRAVLPRARYYRSALRYYRKAGIP